MAALLFLVMAILCSSSIALIFKFSESTGLNRYAVTTANYAAAFTVSGAILLNKGIMAAQHKGAFAAFTKEFSGVFLNSNRIFSSEASFAWAVLSGIAAGVFFFLALVFYQKNVKENGVGISGAFAKMGVLVPLCLSIAAWNETPGLMQWIGIVLALVSILVVNLPEDLKTGFRINISLILLLILNGVTEFSNKLFQKYAIIEYKELFLFCVFFTAFLISLSVTIGCKKPVSWHDLFTGVLVGIPNLFSSYFLILALNRMYAALVFPAFSAGTIVFINLGGMLIFGERLRKKEAVSILVIILSIILINL